MELDYRFWHAKEEVKAFLEENATEGEASDEEMEQSKTNLALMSLVTFFTLSKVFQLRNRVGEGSEFESPLKEEPRNSMGKPVSDDDEVVPSCS